MAGGCALSLAAAPQMSWSLCCWFHCCQVQFLGLGSDALSMDSLDVGSLHWRSVVYDTLQTKNGKQVFKTAREEKKKKFFGA